MKNSSLALVLIALSLITSCNQDIQESAADLNVGRESEYDDSVSTLFNYRLVFRDLQSEDFLVVNVGSDFEKNLLGYLSSFEIKVTVDNTEFHLDNDLTFRKEGVDFEDNRLNESIDPKNNKFEIKFLQSSFPLNARSISINLTPLADIKSELLFPEAITEVTSPSGFRWGRVTRFFVFGNPEWNTPNSNPGYFLAFPYRRSCGLCFWVYEVNQVKEFRNVGDQLIFGSDSWVRVRFTIRHDATNFSVVFKRNAADPWPLI